VICFEALGYSSSFLNIMKKLVFQDNFAKDERKKSGSCSERSSSFVIMATFLLNLL